MAAYQSALAGFEMPRREIGANRSAPGSVSAAIAAYYGDSSFCDALAPTYAEDAAAILERFREQHGDKRIALLERPHIAALLGAKEALRRSQLAQGLSAGSCNSRWAIGFAAG